MPRYLNLILLVVAAAFMVNCAKPKGATTDEQRAYILKMKDDTLAQLYAEKPETKHLIRKAAGYGVFSNISTQLLFLGGGSGYGVVVDNLTGRKTYMKMGLVNVGLGIGIKDFRAVFVFLNRDVMETFVNKGWEFGGEADVALKSEEKGEAESGAASFKRDIMVYQMTEAGIALKAGLKGMKFWRDDDLN